MPRAAPPIVPAVTESSAFVRTESMKIAEASVAEMSAFHPGLRALVRLLARQAAAEKTTD
jgi:hypothetical protein